jgi:predicted PhzF superfamily epimerase YddE/YHI9
LGGGVPLATLLLSLTGEANAGFDIEQGAEMGRPSLLRASARRTPDGIRATMQQRQFHSCNAGAPRATCIIRYMLRFYRKSA